MSGGEIKTVAVIGTGIMGVGIVQSFAEAGLNVRMIDCQKDALDRGFALVRSNLNLFQEFKLLQEEPEAVLSRVEPILSTDTAEKSKGCEFIVESIPEIQDAKRAIFSQLDSLPPQVIIASNTSSMTMDTLTQGLKTPYRMLGLHYFNPAHIIPAVEIHQGKATAPEAVERTRALMLKTRKKPVIVRRSVPGFIINRLTGAMEREIDYLLDEGVVTPEDLDVAVKASYGFRLSCLGPMEAEDMIGLDTAARVSANLFKVLSNRTEPSPDLVAKVKKGELGIRSGKGWYDYTGTTQQEVNDKINRRLLKQLALFRAVEK